jgi:hypothetical protein
MGYAAKIKAQIQAIEMGIEINGAPARANALQPAIAIAVVAVMTRNFWALENIVVGCLM